MTPFWWWCSAASNIAAVPATCYMIRIVIRESLRRHMADVEPVTPDDVERSKLDELPKFVVSAFNAQIKANWHNGEASFTQDAVIEQIIENAVGTSYPKVTAQQVCNYGWVSPDLVKMIYKDWDVEFDRPGYNEFYHARFTFRRKGTFRHTTVP